jgi:hypothetical protein
MNGSKTYRIGDATVIKISEMLLTGFTPRALLPHIEAEVLTKCPEWATSGSVDHAAIVLDFALLPQTSPAAAPNVEVSEKSLIDFLSIPADPLGGNPVVERFLF